MNYWILIIIFLCLLVGAIWTYLYFFQENYIFKRGEKLDSNHQFIFSNKFDEIFIKPNNDSLINALHFRLQKPKGVVLFCHGNKWNLIEWGKKVTYFLNYNYEVLVFDYRNYGKSKGLFDEEGMYNDAVAVYNHLKKSFKEDSIIVYGYSLGGTFATRIASLHKPKELILEAPFYNFKKAAQLASIFTPVFLLKYKFRSDLDIINVTTPITIFHGDKDDTTSFNESKKLLELNEGNNNNFIEILGGTHHDIRESELYKEKLKEILEH